MNIFTNIDALLITNPTNIRYLSGFKGTTDNERGVYLLLTKDRYYLFTDSLYLEQAKHLAKNFLKIQEISAKDPLIKRLNQFVAQLKLKKIGFEENDLKVLEFRKLSKQLKGIRLVPTENRVEKLRMIKSAYEIENIRAAAKLTDECFSMIIKKIKPGVTEKEIAWEIEVFFRTHGAGLAFSPIVAFGKNSSQPHYSFSGPGLARQGLALGKNDIALFDFGARVNGYCADITRIVFVGKPKSEWLRAYNAVLSAQTAAINRLKSRFHVSIHESKQAEVSGAALDKIAKKIIQKAGFTPYFHSLGHNVGLDIHEIPRLTAKKDAILKPGMVFSVEPGIYLEGKFGIRIEDLVLLTNYGLEILSQSTKEITII